MIKRPGAFTQNDRKEHKTMNTPVFEAALFDELEPLFPDTNPHDGKPLHTITVASDTYAGVHILWKRLLKVPADSSCGGFYKSGRIPQPHNHASICPGAHTELAFLVIAPAQIRINPAFYHQQSRPLLSVLIHGNGDPRRRPGIVVLHTHIFPCIRKMYIEIAYIFPQSLEILCHKPIL